MRWILTTVTASLLLLLLPAGQPRDVREEAARFLERYNREYLRFATEAGEAQWKANTEIIKGDSTNEVASRKAQEAFAAFTGKKEVVDSTRFFLKYRNDLTDLQVRQLNAILYIAGNNPEQVKDLVQQRIKLETEATTQLYGYSFTIGGKEVSPNRIDEILRKGSDLSQRLAAWQASKEVGKTLKGTLQQMRELRNKTVQALGYKNYFDYQVADYGMSVPEMMALNKGFIRSVWPLYREIHTYFRYQLARQYGAPVPDYLPAHWLPNRWGQSWEALVNVQGANLDSALQHLSGKEMVARGEEFYTSLGFRPLPATFWSKSSLYPFPADSAVKKNTHASAWHLNLEDDVRSLMSIEPNGEWWETIHHELGHIFYYQAYSRPEIPPVLRSGANRAYHEAFGSLIGLASRQLPYLKARGIFPPATEENRLQKLFREALGFVVFLPWSAGVMTEFEKDLYAGNLPAGRFNTRWWELVKKYQGIVPPSPRSEVYCDAATKTHIIDDAAQYYDYAISYCLLMQLHMHISKNILHQDPHATNYYGSRSTGNFLRGIMQWGQARDWRQVLQESTGDDLNARAMMEYFHPLAAWLKEQNKGRKHTLPAEFEE